ncbi:MAG: hypothetical protein V1777_05220 [Candidatus Micrarchaeota archaeon]
MVATALLTLISLGFTTPLEEYLFYIFSFFILGAGIKYIDDCFDEKVFSKAHGFILAPLLGLFWAFIMAQHPVAATILGAIVLAVFFKGKIDNIAFTAGTLIILLALFLSGFAEFLWIPLIVITVAGILDELGNDWADKQEKLPRLIRWFFEYRFIMKLTVFSFAFLGTFPWEFFFAFLVWDIGYALVYEYVKLILHQRKFYYHPAPNNVLGNNK